MNKKGITFVGIITMMLLGCLVICLLLFTRNFVLHTHDCYDFHVWECNECHKIGGDFLVCSGFCVEPQSGPPRYIEENIIVVVPPCRVNLNESCEEKIPHGCNLPENAYIDGICIPFTKLCYLWK